MKETAARPPAGFLWQSIHLVESARRSLNLRVIRGVTRST